MLASSFMYEMEIKAIKDCECYALVDIIAAFFAEIFMASL
jgi:hypothetical protein